MINGRSMSEKTDVRPSVLMVHDLYRGSMPSGENLSFLQEVELLESNGHRVVCYTASSDDLPTDTLGQKASLVSDLIWSREANREISELIEANGIDLLHVQNTFPQISPAIVRSRSLPVVQSLRNYRLMCVNGLLFRENQICIECIGRTWPWRAIAHGSYRGSRLQSTAIAASTLVHNVARTWKRHVDVFTASSHWLRSVHIEHGLSPDQILVKENLVHPDPGVGSGEGGFVLFAGRLTFEKGLGTLLTAAELLEARSFPLDIVIVGDGPMRHQVQARSQQSNNLKYLGYKSREETLALMGQSSAVLVPSIWFEPFGRTAAEAFAKGTPVLASNIGGPAELVEPSKNGWLVEPGDAEALAAGIVRAVREADTSFRRTARRTYERRFSSAAIYRRLREIYRLAARRCAERLGRPYPP